MQRDQHGSAYDCLLQNDVNLTSPPLSGGCADAHAVNNSDGSTTSGFTSHFTNAPFSIDDYIGPEDTTCPKPGVSAPNGVLKGSGDPGGCTRDLVHRFYQEQYQINGGRQDRYVTGSDAVGLTMGHLRHEEPAGVPLPAQPRRPEVRHRRPTSSRPPTVARSSTTSG